LITETATVNHLELVIMF